MCDRTFLPAYSGIGLGCLLLLLCGTSVSYGQTASDALFFSERLPGTGARLSALGGASIAGLADYGTLYSNPAGLGYLETSQAGGSFRGLVTRDEASYTTSYQPGPNASFTRNTQRAQALRTGYTLGNLVYVYKVPTERGSLVFAGGMNEIRSFDRSVDYNNRNQLSSITDFFLPLNEEVSVEEFAPGESPDDLFFGQEVIEGENAEYLVDFDPNGNGQIDRPLSYLAFQTFAIDFVPGAYDPNAGPSSGFLPAVSGGTQFVQAGDVSESGKLREWNVGTAFEAEKDIMMGLSINLTSGNYTLRDVFEEVDDQNENDGSAGTVDFDQLRLTRRQSSDFSGVNFRGGLSFRWTSFRAGLTLETPTWYTIEETARLSLLTAFDNGDRFVYGETDTEDVGQTEFTYTVRTPWRLGAGASVQMAQATILVDAIFVDWTRLALRAPDNRGTFDRENQLIEDEFQPVVNGRIGIEYELAPLTLRAGFAYQPPPVALSDVSPESNSSSLNLQGAEEVNERTRLYPSVGVGYQFAETLQFDVTWVQERFEDRLLPYTTVNASYVNEQVVRNRVQLGILYSF